MFRGDYTAKLGEDMLISILGTKGIIEVSASPMVVIFPEWSWLKPDNKERKGEDKNGENN